VSRFMSDKYSGLEEYTPGEQPKDMKYIKLNTNESPYPPSPGVMEAVSREASKLNLYSDPECRALTETAARYYGVEYENILMTNGSDEILNFAFMAFCDENRPIVFPELTYGFYPVFAALNHVPYEEIPLKDDLSVDFRDYTGIGKNIVIANPNAPTGTFMPVDEIEEIVSTNRDNVVIIDEAYVDFGGESCLPLVKKYDNLLVTRTFSKSRSMAGARLGFGIGSRELIADMNKIKYSTNPYNVNRMTMAAGTAAFEEDGYYMENCRKIGENREYTRLELEKLGFEMPDSKANFLFPSSPKIEGGELYRKLREKGILVRYFTKKRASDHIRVTIGTREQMDSFIEATAEILKG
jgi:histidinol-phosphate aminotransferase